jgi:hypothetical protein
MASKNSMSKLSKLYAPQNKRRRVRKLEPLRGLNCSPEGSVTRRKSPQELASDHSNRSISVMRAADYKPPKREGAASVEPSSIRSYRPRSPDFPSSRLNLSAANYVLDTSIEKLDILVQRNCSARNDLLNIQERIIQMKMLHQAENEETAGINSSKLRKQILENPFKSLASRYKVLTSKPSEARLTLPPL